MTVPNRLAAFAKKISSVRGRKDAPRHPDPCPYWSCPDPHKVLVPRNLGDYTHASGHRIRHLLGDPEHAHGVGVLRTQPLGRLEDDPEMSGAEYADEGDWVVHASPNEMTHPYVIVTHRARDVRDLGRTEARRGRAIFDRVDAPWVELQRARMPYVKCARCERATTLFKVKDEEWQRVGPQWQRQVLCWDCYVEVVAERGSTP